MSDDAMPMVGIVVVNYFGGDTTLRCLRSLHALTWPEERRAVALVDNGSEPGFAEQVVSVYPNIRLIGTAANLGLGGACNAAFDALRHCEYVALVNNDARPEKDWLEPLVAIMQRRPDAGAATPKVVLDGRFVELELRSQTSRPGRGDVRTLGVQLCGVRIGGVDVTSSVELAGGFWGWEYEEAGLGAFAWSDGRGRALVRLPDGHAASTVSVDVAVARALDDVDVVVAAGSATATARTSARPTWITVDEAPTVQLINNAGIMLRSDGSTVDRGYLDPDLGQLDEAGEVFGFSGAAVLLSRAFIDDLGGFDPRFFLYYEDVDLSWRGRLRGWTYWYEPRSVVHHEHSRTVGGRSPMARHLSERNRLLMLTKVAPREIVGSAIGRLAADIGLAVGRDIMLRLTQRRRPVPQHVAQKVRVLGGYVRLLPHALFERRLLRRTAQDDPILAWIGVEQR